MRGVIVQGPHIPWGLLSSAMFAVCALMSTVGWAETRVIPDPPARQGPPRVGSSGAGPTWDLDGLQVWLGAVGAASRVDDDWDSTFGGELAVLGVAERSRLGVLGGVVGASLWTARGGGRIWADAVVGTPVAGRMVGVTLGPILELSELAHPRAGASAGVWVFVGVTPFARVGVVDELGVFAELGLQIALPVWRRR